MTAYNKEKVLIPCKKCRYFFNMDHQVIGLGQCTKDNSKHRGHVLDKYHIGCEKFEELEDA